MGHGEAKVVPETELEPSAGSRICEVEVKGKALGLVGVDRTRGLGN